jgi:hypothetical protein
MPLYEYEISSTGQSYEVMHSIHREVRTWKELAELLGLELGGIKADTPVSRLFVGRIFVNGNLEDLSKGKVIQRTKPIEPQSCCRGGCED